MDKLTALKTAIDEILDDYRVTAVGETYRVRLHADDQAEHELVVHRHGDDAYDWRVYFATSTPDDEKPRDGIGYRSFPTAQSAVAWALLD